MALSEILFSFSVATVILSRTEAAYSTKLSSSKRVDIYENERRIDVTITPLDLVIDKSISCTECTSVHNVDLPVPHGWRRAAPVRASALFNCCPKPLAGQTSNLGELLWFVEPGHCVRNKLLRSPPLYKVRMDRHVLEDKNATERGFPLRDYCAAFLRLGGLAD
ncbi:MAG: hypothetical protein LQ345_001132 [Seirophora villosa]|nr:MAG: hypothetical protein LQ345_001132 [Seirophora villosa]